MVFLVFHINNSEVKLTLQFCPHFVGSFLYIWHKVFKVLFHFYGRRTKIYRIIRSFKFLQINVIWKMFDMITFDVLSSVWGAHKMALCLCLTSSTLFWILSIFSRISSTSWKNSSIFPSPILTPIDSSPPISSSSLWACNKMAFI